MSEGKDQTADESPRWFWSRRIEIRGYHIAIQIGRIAGLAAWPPGTWPKAPLIYCFVDCWRLKVMP